MRISRESGFTMMELLVVVTIVSVVSAVAVPSFLKSAEVRKSDRAINRLHDIRHAQEMYLVKNRQFATSMSQLGYDAGDDNDYNYSLSNVSTTNYVITASRTAGQKVITMNRDGCVNNSCSSYTGDGGGETGGGGGGGGGAGSNPDFDPNDTGGVGGGSYTPQL